MVISVYAYIIFSILVVILMNYFFMKKPSKKNIIEIEDGKHKDSKRGVILFVLMFGMFTTILNQTTLNVALPTMITDLNVSTTTAQWLITGFMLVNGVLIPISAFLVERFGYRKLFLTAMISFTIGSFVCALSLNFSVVLIGRLIQAIGAGILMPLGMNIFMLLFPPEKRGVAMGTMGIALILAPAIGPTVSGWLVDNYHWNIMFYAMGFIGLLDVIFAFLWFRMSVPTKKNTVDLIGIIFSSIGFGFLLYGFSEAGNEGWGSLIVLTSLIIGIVFIGLFVFRQMKSSNPLLNLNVLKHSIFTYTVLINVIITMSMYGAMLLLPIYLQSIRGFTAVESGLLLLPGALIMGIMGPIAGKIYDKFGIRILAVVGLGITTYATWEFTKLNLDTPYNSILGMYTLRSFGMSLLLMPIMTAGMNALPQKLIQHGTAMSNTIKQIAGSIGTAVLVTIMVQQGANHFNTYSNDITLNNDLISSQMSQVGSSLYAQAMKLSTIQGINDAFVFATILSLIALILAFFLKTPKLNVNKEEQEEIKNHD